MSGGLSLIEGVLALFPVEFCIFLEFDRNEASFVDVLPTINTCFLNKKIISNLILTYYCWCRVVEARCLQHALMFERLKLQLVHLKRDRLLVDFPIPVLHSS